MSAQFPRLFTPVNLRGRTLRNRIVFGAHTANMSVDGLPGERHRAYYEERARGGEQAEEPHHEERPGVDVRDGREEVAVAGTEHQNEQRVLVHQGRPDVGAEGADHEEKSGEDDYAQYAGEADELGIA